MEPTSLIDDAEVFLPPEFLTDEDFLVENNGGGFDESMSFRYFGSTVKPKRDEENFLAGFTRRMDQSTPGDDLSGGFHSSHAFPSGDDNKEPGTTRSTLCRAEIGCGCRNQRLNQNIQSRVSSQAAWDRYCAAVEEVSRMNITDELYDYNSHSGRGLLDLPRKHSSAAAKIPNNGTGYYSHQSFRYQNLQAIQFQQQQLMKHHNQLVQQRVNSNKNGGHVDLSSFAWSNQLPRRGNSNMRAVFLGDTTGKRGSTGTGVFLPRRVNHNSPANVKTREKHTIATVLVPSRVAQVVNLNLDEPAVQPVVRSSGNLTGDALWRQRSSNTGGFMSQMHGGVKAEQAVNELRLPSDWAY